MNRWTDSARRDAAEIGTIYAAGIAFVAVVLLTVSVARLVGAF